MSKKDKKEKGQDSKKAAGQQQQQQMPRDLPVTIVAQYIRDLSFENPNATDVLRAEGQLPEMDINIGMDARKITDDKVKNLYEVILSVRAEAKQAGKTVFLAELQYGITLVVGDVVPEDSHHPLLLIEIPRMAFPFVRQILAGVTSQGGYPPLLLNPVDFHALYMQRFGKEIEEARKNAEAAATGDKDKAK